MSRFECEVPVRWGDVDACGVVNNATYLSYVEQARWLYFEHLGLLEDARFPFVLGETTVRYLRSAHARSRLRVVAWTTRLGRKSFDMEFELYDAEQRCATARATLVWMGEGGSRPIPDEARRVLQDFDHPAS